MGVRRKGAFVFHSNSSTGGANQGEVVLLSPSQDSQPGRLHCKRRDQVPQEGPPPAIPCGAPLSEVLGQGDMMLFGLSRSPELNGRTVRVLGDGFPNEQGRIAVQIEDEPPRTILVQPQNLGHRAHSKLVELIFSSPDVISTVVDRLCLDAEHAARGSTGDMHLGDLEAAALVCKSFATVVHGSDEFWKLLCNARWRMKFGFRAR